MPKFTKCWYKNCDSDNRQDPKLLFYKFPRDSDRCEKWVRNCSNDELTTIWNGCPEKVAALRICQRHFLKEFLGSSSRLVGHAVPAPFGITLDRPAAEKFMVDCASLKSTSNLARQPRQPSEQNLPTHQQEHYALAPYFENQVNDQDVMNIYAHGSNNDTFGDTVAECYQQVSQFTQQPQQHHHLNSGLLMPIDQGDINHSDTINNTDCQLLEQYVPSSSDQMSTVNEMPSNSNQYDLTYHQTSEHVPVEAASAAEGNDFLVYPQQHENANHIQEVIEYQQDDQQISGSTTISSPRTSRLGHRGNPKINYDREGRLVSIQYSNAEIESMIKSNEKEQYQAHVEALKHKVRHYQRRLAVINHRYQKLKSQTKGRSNRTRLLESLKICRPDFNPCVYEIFKRQVKGPSSKHGNRWSDEVKAFSSSVYLRSRCAYKFIRKTIDLPSESIVKRYIVDKKLSKLPQAEHDDQDDQRTEADEKSNETAVALA